MADLPRKIKYVPELFDYIDGMKTRKERIETIRQFVARGDAQVTALRGVVRFTYHPEVIMQLPEGAPPYKEQKYTDYNHAAMPLVSVLRKRVQYFTPISPMFIKDDERLGNESGMKRERVFIQTLEGMFEEDAKLLIQIKDKKLTGWKNINENLFREALPSWFDWEQTEESKSEPEPVKEEEPESETPTKPAPKRRGRPKGSKNKSTAAKKSTESASSTPKRRGRPPKKKPEE